ncbi:MAG: endonuclease/exonuclease/phosphatase family protein [Clostridiales bacterium]|nr:endonuclease/exonuclease/phosphatase family protein [Clostridiales bacterium]
MIAIPHSERQRLGSLLEHASQTEVMSLIPQFEETELTCCVTSVPPFSGVLNVLVFNMERGVHLNEIADFLEQSPEACPFDVILANELDDGCARSGQVNTTKALAERLGMDAVFGLEFIELVNRNDEKGYHGNAIFSRFPIKRSRIVRLPEEYNWYFDRQRRIGGRLAILAELDLGLQSVTVGTIHLENRTNGIGRKHQLQTVLDAADSFSANHPVVLGGDLNTNTFDGRDKAEIQRIASDSLLQRSCLEDVFEKEGCLPAAVSAGYTPVPESPLPTRRKPLPQGGDLPLRLDWILLRGACCGGSRTVSTKREDCGFAKPECSLERFAGEELSDHNAVWSRCLL